MREALKITTEASFGVFNSGATSGQKATLTLNGGNQFTMRPVPNRYTIRDAGGRNRTRMVGTEQIGLAGTLTTPLHPSQAGLILGHCFTPTGTPEDLTSFTIDHRFQSADSSGTFLYKRYLGCKVAKASLSASNEGEGTKFMLSLDIVGSTPATITSSDFAPVIGDLATDLPYTFQDSSGLVSIGSARTQYRDLEITVTNVLDVLFDENQYANRIKFCGRDGMFSFTQRLNNNNDRSPLEAVTAQTVTIALNNGTVATTFNFGAKSIFSSVTDDLPLGREFYQKKTLMSIFDPALSGGSGNDFTITVV